MFGFLTIVGAMLTAMVAYTVITIAFLQTKWYFKLSKKISEKLIEQMCDVDDDL